MEGEAKGKARLTIRVRSLKSEIQGLQARVVSWTRRMRSPWPPLGAVGNNDTEDMAYVFCLHYLQKYSHAFGSTLFHVAMSVTGHNLTDL